MGLKELTKWITVPQRQVRREPWDGSSATFLMVLELLTTLQIAPQIKGDEGGALPGLPRSHF